LNVHQGKINIKGMKIDNPGNPKFQNLNTASLLSFFINTAALFLEVDSCGCREKPQKIPAQAKIQ
jgi:hypothetical protein